MDNKKNAGFVIIAVTVILVALTLLGMLFLNLTGIDSTATNNYVNNIQAEMTARAGLEYAVYVLNMDKYGTDTVVYNNNNCRYLGTTTMFSDENYDAYTEEWLGTGTGKIFGNATALSNDVDNNGDGSKDSNWLDAPFSLDRGLRAQYAILIEDVGESRININATGNLVGTSGSFIYGTGATTYDIRIQDILGATAAKNIIAGTGSTTARLGANGVPGNTGTNASQFQPRRYTGDDRPYDVLDAADICFGTCASSTIYQSRLRNIINNETLFQTIRNGLTAYSFDAVMANNGLSSLKLPDNKNYYRLKLDNTTSVSNMTNQLQIVGFGNGTATQLAVHIKDYLDTDTDITLYGTSTKYGLEPHPFINELYHTGTHSTQPRQNLVELYNPFDVAIGSSTMSINGSTMDLVLKTTRTQYQRLSGCTWTAGTVTTTLCPIGMASFSIQSKGYTTLGYGTQNTAVSLSGTQTVTGFDIYDYDSKKIPMAVTVTLMGSSSALNNGEYLVLDEVQPNAYNNSIRGEDVLWLLYQLIAYIKANITNAAALNGSIQRAGDGVWDYDGNSANGIQHSSEPPNNSALDYLVDNTTSHPPPYANWAATSADITNAINQLGPVTSGASLQGFVNSHSQIDDTVETKIIADAQEIIVWFRFYQSTKTTGSGKQKHDFVRRTRTSPDRRIRHPVILHR
ncbi:MAG: hypothetical protein HZB37_02225 [Planctomycetes bacterium]|nr:hypothetical protein [Planctomycetota bacterium]